MKVLLIHPNDACPRKPKAGGWDWDLVIDLGRASSSTYAEWSRETACPVKSLYDFAHDLNDLRCTSDLLQSGMGKVLDNVGIDWWNVLCVFFASQMEQLILIGRLAKELGADCELQCTRADFRVDALHSLVGGRVVNLETTMQSVARRSRHYASVASNFSFREIFQIVQDKFDARHAVRRHLVKRARIADRPWVLLPSAYINVSRMALSYAALMPEDQFPAGMCPG